MGDEHKGK